MSEHEPTDGPQLQHSCHMFLSVADAENSVVFAVHGSTARVQFAARHLHPVEGVGKVSRLLKITKFKQSLKDWSSCENIHT